MCRLSGSEFIRSIDTLFNLLCSTVRHFIAELSYFVENFILNLSNFKIGFFLILLF